ncbi:metallophosphoesterase [Candidatus Parcubacteria bacterium]|nr:metallophosphoesterase [Candidatus Parcubacteria bacterium]
MSYLILLLAISFILTVHFVAYRFFIIAFRIRRKRIKKTLFLILGILSFSFIISAILSRVWANGFIKIFYLISSIWYGFMVNFIMAMGLFLIVLIISKISKFKINKVLISRIFLALTVLYSIFGIYSAFFPIIKNLTVSIRDLPEEWEGKTIVQLSDIHLGQIIGTRFMNRVNEKVDEINPEIVVITGDLFDGMNKSLNSFIEPLNNIKAKKGVYYVTGNHETYIGVKKALDTLEKTEINVLDDEVALVNGLQIIGVSYPGLEKDIANDKNYNFNTPSLLLYHAPTDIRIKQIDHNNMYYSPKINFDYAKELGVDLQLSGHTHKGQIFPFNFITNYMYNGYDYGLHKEGYFSIYISSGTGFWGPAMRTGSRSEIVAITLKKK